MALNVHQTNSSVAGENVSSGYCGTDFENALSAYDDMASKTFGKQSKSNAEVILSKTRTGSRKISAHSKIKNDDVSNNEVKTNGTNEAGLRISREYQDAPNIGQNANTHLKIAIDRPFWDSTPESASKFQSNGYDHVGLDPFHRVTAYSHHSPMQSKWPGVKTVQVQPSKDAEYAWQTGIYNSAIELIEADPDIDSIAVGLPDTRRVTIIPSIPRPRRTKNFLNLLKRGLTDWIDLQSNKLQQAELYQNCREAETISALLNRLKQRLRTINLLNRDYMQYYKLYRDFHNSRDGKLSEKHKSKSHGILYNRELSKSALVLTSTKTTSSTKNDDQQRQQSVTMETPTAKSQRPQSTVTSTVLSGWGTIVPPRPQDRRPSDDHMTDGSILSGSDGTPVPKLRLSIPAMGEVKWRSGKRSKLDSGLSTSVKQEGLCKQKLCQIEAQVEYLSGTMKCEVIGISGSSQYISKDEFKMSTKHGNPNLSTYYELHDTEVKLHSINTNQWCGGPAQAAVNEEKWTSHGRVQSSQSTRVMRGDYATVPKTGAGEWFPTQIWDNQAYVFSPTISGMVTVKMTEMKRFGKEEIIQHQAFDITGLMRPKSYRLSTSLKHSGRVRFGFQIQWSPLADTDDSNLVYYKPSSTEVHRSRSTGIRFVMPDLSGSTQTLDADNSTTASDRTSPSNTNTDQTPSSSMDSAVNMSRAKSVTLLSHRKYKPVVHSRSQRQQRSPQYRQLQQPKHRQGLSPTSPHSSNKVKESNVTIISVRSRAEREQSGVHVIPTRPKHWISMPNLLEDQTKNLSPEDSEPQIKRKFPSNVPPVIIVSSDSSADDLESDKKWMKSSIFRKTSFQAASGLREKLNKLYYELRSLDELPEAFQELLEQLKQVISDLITRLENTTLAHKERSGSSHGTSASPTLRDSTNRIASTPRAAKTSKPRLGKKDTMTELMSSFAFLEELYEIVEDNKPNAGSYHGTCDVTATEPNAEEVADKVSGSQLTSGLFEVDRVLVWHLDYIERLLKQLTVRNTFKDDGGTVSLEPMSAKPDLCTEELPLKKICNVLKVPIHSYVAAIAMLGQVDVIETLYCLLGKIYTNPQSTLVNYTTEQVGQSERHVDESSVSTVLHSLVWSQFNRSKNEALTRSNGQSGDEAMGPCLNLNLRELQERLVTHFEVEMTQRWPDLDVKRVVESLLEDLLDVEINGEDVTTIPLTQLQQRLQVNHHQDEATVSESTRVSRGPIYDSHLEQTLFYLAGQCSIQDGLRGTSPSAMLSKLNHPDGVIKDLPRSMNNLIAGDDISTSSMVILRYSTRTWHTVASLVDNTDLEVARKANSLMVEFHRQLTDVANPSQAILTSELTTVNEPPLPILFINGPPIHLTQSILPIILQHGVQPVAYFLPPLWISLIWGVEQEKLLRTRITCLRALGLLLERQHMRALTQTRLKQTPSQLAEQANTRSVSKWIQSLAKRDSEKSILSLAQSITDRLDYMSKTEQPQIRVARGNQAVRIISSRPPARR